MNNVIEFGTRSNKVIEMKQIRFNQLKGWNFSGILDENEEKELDDLEKWLKIHS